MKPLEKYKDVTIGEQTFRIKKFNAMVGAFMMVKVTGILAPVFKHVNVGKVIPQKPEEVDLSAFNISGILGELTKLSEEDFNYIQTKCLQSCSEVLPSGLTPVLNENGTFGVMNLEDDMVTVMALTVHVLMFNLSSVFTASPLQSLLGGLSSTSQKN